jgi:hypothetical protein
MAGMVFASAPMIILPRLAHIQGCGRTVQIPARYWKAARFIVGTPRRRHHHGDRTQASACRFWDRHLGSLVPLESSAAPDEQTWLTRYGGGWPLLFPNGGDACMFDGNFHGFHGEASISPWEVEVSASMVLLTRRFTTVPVRMQREMTVDGDVLTIREIVEAEGERPVLAMWGHHPTFGSDLLDGDFEIQSGACNVTVDRL